MRSYLYFKLVMGVVPACFPLTLNRWQPLGEVVSPVGRCRSREKLAENALLAGRRGRCWRAAPAAAAAAAAAARHCVQRGDNLRHGHWLALGRILDSVELRSPVQLCHLFATDGPAADQLQPVRPEHERCVHPGHADAHLSRHLRPYNLARDDARPLQLPDSRHCGVEQRHGHDGVRRRA